MLAQALAATYNTASKSNIVLALTFAGTFLHNSHMAFADWFGVMPKVEVWQGLSAFVLNGKTAQAGFFEATQTVVVPEHSHQGQWGIVVSGVVELTIGGVHHRLESGNSYTIPADVPHSAVVHQGAVFIDVWEGKRLEVND
jgi:quercetin dioxygenase-like cupin family protein